MATEIWVNIGSGYLLLPDGTKPLPEPMLTDHLFKSSDIHIRAITQEIPQPSITKICLKITCLKFHSNSPGANELRPEQTGQPLEGNMFKYILLTENFYLLNQIF